jgi:hypothetical protein
MNYLNHYLKLVRRSERRGWTKESAGCYVEEHHVFPKGVYGENNRVVYLTAREHLLAHLLLWRGFRKRYGVENWRTSKVAFAVTAMRFNSSTHNRRPLTCRQFELVKTARSEAMQGDNHWSRQPGNVSPFVALNTDPERAAWLGEINKQNHTERYANGSHHWLTDPTTHHELTYDDCSRGGSIGGKMPWWTNGESSTRSHTCPGEGWRRGRKPWKKSSTPGES